MEKNWNEIRELAGEYAEANLLSGLNCAESVYDACIRSGAIDASLDTVGYLSGFGGGGGASGYTCGALAGAIFVNGVVHGRKNPGARSKEERGNELRERVYKRYNNMVSAFIKKAGSGLCKDIVAGAGGYVDPKNKGNCARVTGEAARIAVDYLQIDEDKVKDFQYDMSIIEIPDWREK